CHVAVLLTAALPSAFYPLSLHDALPILREWRDLHHQLHLACRQASLVENHQPAGYDSIHCALLSGLLSHVGFRHEEREYLGVRKDRKSTRLNSSHVKISYAVFCLKKKNR